ncbi:hypothetical protein SNE40_022510 [Patella caerulea]|uniref:Little elongation complex subunit 2 C-terminal domain-containing protein n=1 Tax=Patella caerulea TaxID=87958 RepID=A0AAN8G5M1_PATCE
MEEKIKWKEPINGFNTFFTEESYRRMVKEETFESKLLSSINALKLKSAALLEASKDEGENTQNKFPEEKDDEYYLPNKDILTHRKAGLQQKSSLSKFEQRKYIDLFLKLRHKTYQVGQNLSNVEKKELADFEALQMRVTAEQSEFLINLREVSNNQGVYTFLSPAGRRYFQERQHEKLKIVEELPRHYININKTLPLAMQVNIDTPPPTLQFVKTLAELGSAPKITLPTLIVNEKKTIPMEYDKISAQYPPVHHQKVEGKFNHEVCSKDSNCEVLACKTFSHIVVCTSVLRCLVNNHAPDFSRTWEIPFFVKVHDVEYQGKIVKQKVVYFDKPLPQKNLTMRDKNTLHHKYALRAFLAKVNRKNINLPKEPLKHIMTTCVKSKVGDNSKTSKVEDDDLFGDTYMDDVETFGGDISPVKSSKELTDSSQKTKCTPSKPVCPQKTSKGGDDFFSDTNIDDIETFGDPVKSANSKLRVSTRSKTKCEQTTATKTPPEPPPSTSGSTSNKSNTVLDVEELNKDLFGSESETDTKSVIGETSTIDEADTATKGGNSDITSGKDTEMIKNVEKSKDEIPETGLKSEHLMETSESQPPDAKMDDTEKNLDEKLPVDESSFSELSDIEPNTEHSKETGVESKTKSHINTVSDAPLTSGCDSEMDNLVIDAPACDKPNKIVPNIDDTDSSDTDANLVIDIDESDESNQKTLKKRKVEEIFSPNESMDENFICNPSPIRVINLAKKDKNVPNRNNSAIFKQKWRLRRLSSGGETETSAPINGNVVRLRSGRLINSDASADERSSVGTTSQSDSESVFTPPKKPRKMEEICSPDVIPSDDGSEFPVKVIPLDPQEYGQIIMLKNKPKKRRSVRKSSVEKETPRVLRSRNRSISTESGENDGSDSIVSDEGSTLDSGVKQRRRSARLQTSVKEEKTPVINEQKPVTKDRNRKEKPEIVNVPSMEQCDIKTEELPAKRKRGRPRKKRVENCESITTDVEQNLTENISTDVKPDVADGQEMETMITGTIINRNDEMQNDESAETKPMKNSIPVETNNSQANSTLVDKMSVNLKSETRKNNTPSALDKVEEKSRICDIVPEQSKEKPPIVLDKTTAKSKERKSHVMSTDAEKTHKNAQISKDKTTVEIPGNQQQTQRTTKKPKEQNKKSTKVNPLDSILGKSSTTDSKPNPYPDLKEPIDGQIAYSLWKFTGLSMIIRTSSHGMVRDACQNYQGHIVPKVEYQVKYGLEQVSLEEASNAWISCYVKPYSRLIRGRVGAASSELYMLENLDLNQILLQANHFNPVAALCSLHNIFMKLYNLEEGSYLLYHESGSPNCQVKQPTDGNKRGTYDLHFSHLGPSEIDTKNHGIWYPIDTNIILPHHRKNGRIPATFEPEDLDDCKGKSSFRGGKNKKNKNKKK